MISLKSFLPVLSDFTELSVTTLYERQRALVRLGLLPKPRQSGRNSGGAQATPGSVTIMLMSVLVTDSLSEMDERIAEYLNMKACKWLDKEPGEEGQRLGTGLCFMTNEPTVFRAVRAVLSGAVNRKIMRVTVNRTYRNVQLQDDFLIEADPNEGYMSSIFGNWPDAPRPINREVRFEALQDLAQEIRKIHEIADVELPALD